MMYPYLTLNDDTEITHSEMKEDGTVKVYIETPDETGGFHSAVCWLPEYRWEDVQGYTDAEMEYYKELVRNNAHRILDFSIATDNKVRSRMKTPEEINNAWISEHIKRFGKEPNLFDGA